MEAEIVAFAHSCRKSFSIIGTIEKLSDAFFLSVKNPVKLNFLFREYNYVVFIFADTYPPQFTP